MANKFIYLIFKYFWFFFLNFLPKKDYSLRNEELNFERVNFINKANIKKIFFKENIYSTKFNNFDIHSFNYLFVARQIGGKSGIEFSNNNIFHWYKLYKWKINFPWSEILTASRFINIIYNYNFITGLSSKNKNILLNKIIYIHFRKIAFNTKTRSAFEVTLKELKAHLLGSLIYNLDETYSLEKITQIIKKHLDSLGFHKSYNPLNHAKFLNELHEIKNILLYFKITVPDILNFSIINMASLLKHYFHDDGSICMFNGSNNTYLSEILLLLKNNEILKKRKFNKNANGIAFYNDKNKRIFLDVVQPTKTDFNKNLCASSLALEFSAFGEKIITNCGAIEKIGKNPEYLRYSAAHSTITLQNTNISEIRMDKIHKRFPDQVSYNSSQSHKSTIWSGSHNGYMKNFKKIIKRKIIIDNLDNKVSCEDSIISLKAKNKKIVYHIRFHLMPDIQTSLTNGKRGLIMKTKKNIKWLFKADTTISLENSIYVDKNKTQQIQQIVLSGTTSQNKIIEKWSLEKI